MIGLDKNYIKKTLTLMYPNAKCELNYSNDYEFLIAVMLSAQTTDKAVNKVTNKLFSKYNTLDLLNGVSLEELEVFLMPLGNFRKKSIYIKEIVAKLLNECDSKVINDKEYLMNLPGVGIKTVNVVLGELFNVEAFAVDTHVYRVSYRFGISDVTDNVSITEKKLMDFFDKEDYISLHHKFIFHGRYTCFKRSPNCDACLFKGKCIVDKK